MPYYGFYFDPTYLLVLIGVVLCMIASARVKTTYKKYEKVGSRSGYTADQVAYMILRNAGITDVSIHHISGCLRYCRRQMMFCHPGHTPLNNRILNL